MQSSTSLNLSFRETRELLKRAEQFHRRFEDRCRDVVGHIGGERMRMVLAFLTDQNQALAEELRRFEKHDGEKLKKTWFQYSPDRDPENCLRSLDDLASDLSAEQLVERAIEFNECLGGFYEEAARMAPYERVTEMFESLSRKSLRARKDLMAGLNRIQ